MSRLLMLFVLLNLLLFNQGCVVEMDKPMFAARNIPYIPDFSGSYSSSLGEGQALIIEKANGAENNIYKVTKNNPKTNQEAYITVLIEPIDYLEKYVAQLCLSKEPEKSSCIYLPIEANQDYIKVHLISLFTEQDKEKIKKLIAESGLKTQEELKLSVPGKKGGISTIKVIDSTGYESLKAFLALTYDAEIFADPKLYGFNENSLTLKKLDVMP